MADNKEYYEQKKASLMAKSVRNVANLQSLALLLQSNYAQCKAKYNRAVENAKKNIAISIYNPTQIINRKMIESELKQAENNLKLAKKSLDDLENEI